MHRSWREGDNDKDEAGAERRGRAGRGSVCPTEE